MVIYDKRQGEAMPLLAVSARTLLEKIKETAPDNGKVEIKNNSLNDIMHMYADGFYFYMNFYPSNIDDLEKIVKEKYWCYLAVKLDSEHPGWWMMAMLDPQDWCPVMAYSQYLQAPAKNN